MTHRKESSIRRAEGEAEDVCVAGEVVVQLGQTSGRRGGGEDERHFTCVFVVVVLKLKIGSGTEIRFSQAEGTPRAAKRQAKNKPFQKLCSPESINALLQTSQQPNYVAVTTAGSCNGSGWHWLVEVVVPTTAPRTCTETCQRAIAGTMGNANRCRENLLCPQAVFHCCYQYCNTICGIPHPTGSAAGFDTKRCCHAFDSPCLCMPPLCHCRFAALCCTLRSIPFPRADLAASATTLNLRNWHSPARRKSPSISMY